MTVTGTTKNACPCCTGNVCALECRSKASVGNLCGFSEFVDPSVPPKKYRRMDWDGTGETCNSRGLICDDYIVRGLVRFSGNYQYDKDTCEQTNGLVYESADPIPPPCGAGASFTTNPTPGPGFSPPGFDSYADFTEEPTKQQWDAVEGCLAFPAGNASVTQNGQIKKELSDEDTEQDAIARSNDDIPEWGACTNCHTCPSFITVRLPGQFSFGYQQGQSRVHAIGLTVGNTYEITTKFFRRVLGTTGPFEFFSELVETWTPSTPPEAASHFTEWADVPNEAGWETRAEFCTIVDVSA